MTEQESNAKPPMPAKKPPRLALRPNQKALLILIASVGIAGIYITLLRKHSLDASAAFYIGLPMILAVLYTLTDPSKSATGMILKGLTLSLLLSAPLLQEGFLCIVFAAPIFYIIGGIVGVLIDQSRKRKTKSLHSAPAVLLLGIFALEGTHPALTIDREQTVRVEKIIAADVAAVQAQLAQPLQLGDTTAAFLKIFPFPVQSSNTGLQVGGRQQHHFVYYKHFFFNAHVGDLIFEVVERGDNYVLSRAVKDTSYLHTYLDWQSAKVSWQALADGRTKLTWEVRFRRKLDPAWYFAPLEQYTVRLATESLIDYAATPVHARRQQL